MSERVQRLELTWIGKDLRPRLEPRILLEDLSKSYHAKERVKEEDIFDNKLIFGDNLLALKALEQDYRGRVKCIYIDPPYNTGNAFEHYDDGLEHSIWLSLMRDRLELLHTLLAKDGSIWISIDSDEGHYLKVLCDEIFGRRNFIDEIIWERAYAPVNLKKTVSRSHDLILIYAKNAEGFTLNKLPRTAEMDTRYKNPDNDPRGPWKSGDLSVGPAVEKNIYEIVTPSGRKVLPPAGTSWRVSQTRFAEMAADKRIWFGPTGTNVPSLKRFLSEVKDGIVAKTIWQHSDVGHNQDAKREVKAFNSENVFATPKPERLIERILHLATQAGDLVLDSFAGSGTTGAVAHKMGRKWIMIELGEHCHTHIIPRLQQVVDGTDQGGISKAHNWQGGGGFRYYRLAPSMLQQNHRGMWIISKEYNAEMLAEAMCKHMGFTYAPDEDHYWIHGHATERAFIYVTTHTLTHQYLRALSKEVGPERSLLICCGAFTTDPEAFDNLILKKIPKTVLQRCEWGKDDYSLNVASLAPVKHIEQTEATHDLFSWNEGEESHEPTC